jgi:hypothetical protein
LTGFGFPLLSTPAEVEGRFFVPDSVVDEGDCDAFDPFESMDLSLAMTATGIFYEANPGFGSM